MSDNGRILQCNTCGAYNVYANGVSSVSLNTHTGLLQCYRCFCKARLHRRDSEEAQADDDNDDGDMFEPQ